MLGLQIWAKWVNSKGGVNGHEVQLFSADDAGDGARHRALVQDLVESKGVLAFVSQPSTVAGRSSVEYLNAKRVPVIGLQAGESWAYESPMFFPQAPTGEASYRAAMTTAGPGMARTPSGRLPPRGRRDTATTHSPNSFHGACGAGADTPSRYDGRVGCGPGYPLAPERWMAFSSVPR